MSAMDMQGLSGVPAPPLNAHVFRCPQCRVYTSLLSPFSFISRETAECDKCGQIFVIENDVARVLGSVEL
jgi:uncharacterized paraquat-inducible protein A